MSPLSDIACPACGECSLKLESRFVARDVGDFSLAGVQTKFAATEVPHVVCGSCGVAAQVERA